MNPSPIPQLQVGPGFKLSLSIEMSAEASGFPVPLMDNDRPFCLSLHLKGVCNSNCSSCHTHRVITSQYHGTLVAWKARYCEILPSPPVQNINNLPWSNAGSTGDTTCSTKLHMSRIGCSGQIIQRRNPWKTQGQPSPGTSIIDIREEISLPTGGN